MALKSAPYYWVVCDSCGERCEYGDFAALSDAGDAVGEAIDHDWSVSDKHDKHHCHKCEPFCEQCGEPAGPLCGERDYMCQACFDAAADDAEAEEQAKGT